jgi:cell division protein FtsZ
LAKMHPARRVLKYTWQNMEGEKIRQSSCCRTLVIGIGRAGNNTVTRLMEAGITGAECVALNTDAAHLNVSKAHRKILIGEKLTKGLGVDGNPQLGRAAAEESRRKIEELLSKFDMVFITTGFGGGTGTGSAPVIAEIANRRGITTVGVVTMPFHVERIRTEHAAEALAEMRRQCDAVVVIDNNKLMQLVPRLPTREAFKVADRVLANMIKGIIDTFSTPSPINLDFADFKTIVTRGGMAVVGVGESNSPSRAEEAVRNALRTPMLNADYAGASGAFVQMAGNSHMTIEEADRVGEIVTERLDNDALVIWGARVDPRQDDKLKVMLVMTGLNSSHFGRFDAIAPELFNLEPHAESEKQLGIDLDLYQMENF